MRANTEPGIVSLVTLFEVYAVEPWNPGIQTRFVVSRVTFWEEDFVFVLVEESSKITKGAISDNGHVCHRQQSKVNTWE